MAVCSKLLWLAKNIWQLPPMHRSGSWKLLAKAVPYGMALLAAYLVEGNGLSLESYLDQKVFANAEAAVLDPDAEDVAGFRAYLTRFWDGLSVERSAIGHL